MAKGKFKFKKWMVVGLIIVGLIFVLYPMLKGSGIGDAFAGVGKKLQFGGTSWA